MTDFKLRGVCGGCNKVRWFIRKRQVTLPIGVATSKKLFCGKCAEALSTFKKHE